MAAINTPEISIPGGKTSAQIAQGWQQPTPTIVPEDDSKQGPFLSGIDQAQGLGYRAIQAVSDLFEWEGLEDWAK